MPFLINWRRRGEPASGARAIVCASPLASSLNTMRERGLIRSELKDSPAPICRNLTTISSICGWSATAGPTNPNRPLYLSPSSAWAIRLSIERKRIGLKVLLTRQKRHPQLQPRPTSIRYKPPSSVSLVSMVEATGKSSRSFAHWRTTGVPE